MQDGKLDRIIGPTPPGDGEHDVIHKQQAQHPTPSCSAAQLQGEQEPRAAKICCQILKTS
jgi:hypothetical protein